MRTIVFGCGTGLEYFLKYEKDQEDVIVSIIDNNPNLWTKEINNIKVRSPKEISNLNYEKIIITSRYFIEVYSQLLMMEIPEQKISVTQFFLSA